MREGTEVIKVYHKLPNMDIWYCRIEDEYGYVYETWTEYRKNGDNTIHSEDHKYY